MTDIEAFEKAENRDDFTVPKYFYAPIARIADQYPKDVAQFVVSMFEYAVDGIVSLYASEMKDNRLCSLLDAFEAYTDKKKRSYAETCLNNSIKQKYRWYSDKCIKEGKEPLPFDEYISNKGKDTE